MKTLTALLIFVILLAQSFLEAEAILKKGKKWISKHGSSSKGSSSSATKIKTIVEEATEKINESRETGSNRVYHDILAGENVIRTAPILGVSLPEAFGNAKHIIERSIQKVHNELIDIEDETRISINEAVQKGKLTVEQAESDKKNIRNLVQEVRDSVEQVARETAGELSKPIIDKVYEMLTMEETARHLRP